VNISSLVFSKVKRSIKSAKHHLLKVFDNRIVRSAYVTIIGFTASDLFMQGDHFLRSAADVFSFSFVQIENLF